MTALEAEVLLTLQAEAGHAPMPAASIHRVLYCLGRLPSVDTTVADVDAALAVLLAGGHVESVRTRKAGARYRVMPQPEPAA